MHAVDSRKRRISKSTHLPHHCPSPHNAPRFNHRPLPYTPLHPRPRLHYYPIPDHHPSLPHPLQPNDSSFPDNTPLADRNGAVRRGQLGAEMDHGVGADGDGVDACYGDAAGEEG